MQGCQISDTQIFQIGMRDGETGWVTVSSTMNNKKD